MNTTIKALVLGSVALAAFARAQNPAHMEVQFATSTRADMSEQNVYVE